MQLSSRALCRFAPALLAVAALPVALAAWPATLGDEAPDPAVGPRPPLRTGPPPEAPALPAIGGAIESKTLLAKPEVLLGRTVRLPVQLHSFVEDWNPYLTRFGPLEHVALVAWADEQLPWLQADYEHPAIVVFVPRGGALEAELRRHRRHDRLELTLKVEELLLGRGWARVLDARPTTESIPEGSVLHVITARKLIRDEAWVMAIDELERALAAPLPQGARAKVVELRDWCRERRDERK